LEIFENMTFEGGQLDEHGNSETGVVTQSGCST
jgi:hypothetical protein